MRVQIDVKGIEKLRSKMQRLSQGLPKAGNSMSLELAKFGTARARGYAQGFSSSGTLSNSIRPQKIKDGWKVIVERPGGNYAFEMENGMSKPRYLTRDRVSYAGYTVGDWMDMKGISPNIKGIWVGRGNGMPKTGYKYMDRAFWDTVKVTPLQIQKQLRQVIK